MQAYSIMHLYNVSLEIHEEKPSNHLNACFDYHLSSMTVRSLQIKTTTQ